MNDHEHLARLGIEGVQDWQEREGETDATLLAAAILANAEATLALADAQRESNAIQERIAEQARVANALTVSQMEQERDIHAKRGLLSLAASRGAVERVYGPGTAYDTLRPDIAAALEVPTEPEAKP